MITSDRAQGLYYDQPIVQNDNLSGFFPSNKSPPPTPPPLFCRAC